MIFQLELQKINVYTSPRDKLVCISNCFRIINSKIYLEIISNCNNGSAAHGADDSLPMFVYVVLKSKTEKLFSNYYYIKKLRYPPRLDHRDNVEFRWTFTSMKIALKFLLELNESKLKLATNENYEELTKGSREKSRSCQTSPIPSENPEVELGPIVKLSYQGVISVNHFLENPQDLQNFINDYYNLLNIRKRS